MREIFRLDALGDSAGERGQNVASRRRRVSVCVRLTAVVDGVGHHGFERPGEAAVAVLQEGGEAKTDDVQVHDFPQLLGLLQDGRLLAVCRDTGDKQAGTRTSGQPGDSPGVCVCVCPRVCTCERTVSSFLSPPLVSEPSGQNLDHALLGHMEDSQVAEPAGSDIITAAVSAY